MGWWWISLLCDAPYARGSRAGAHMRMGGDGAPRHRARRVPHAPARSCALGNERGRGWLAGCLDADLPQNGVPARARRARSVGAPASRKLRLRRRRLLARRYARLAFGCWRARALAPGRDVSSRVQLTREKKAELEFEFEFEFGNSNSNSTSTNRTNSNSHELELEKLEEKCW